MPQTAYCSYSGAFVSHSGRTAYIPQFKPPTDFDMHLTSHTQPWSAI